MKSSIAALLSLFLFLSCKEAPRTSRHTPFCSCEHEIDGKSQKLEIAPQSMEILLDEMVALMGLPKRVFNLCGVQMKTTVGMTSLYQGKYAIYVDPRLDELSRTTQAFVLGHEMGHALGNLQDSQDVDHHQLELDCDYFSAYLMFRMEIPLDEALDDLDFFFSGNGSDTHPAGKYRKAAFISGYEAALSALGNTVMN